jgi:hypothetical protein
MNRIYLTAKEAKESFYIQEDIRNIFKEKLEKYPNDKKLLIFLSVMAFLIANSAHHYDDGELDILLNDLVENIKIMHVDIQQLHATEN